MMKCKKQLGFSLLEIVIVASVVMTGFIGILILAERTIQFRSINQKSLIASQLAQEGLELTRYYRNANWLYQPDINFDHLINNKLAGLSYPNTNGNEVIFAIDYDNRDVLITTPDDPNGPNILTFYNIDGDQISSDCAGDFDCYLKSDYATLYQDSARYNFYCINKDFSSAPLETYVDSGFKRAIKTIYYTNDTTEVDDDYVYVVSKVYWQDRGKDYFYTTATYLFDYDWYY